MTCRTRDHPLQASPRTKGFAQRTEVGLSGQHPVPQAPDALHTEHESLRPAPDERPERVYSTRTTGTPSSRQPRRARLSSRSRRGSEPSRLSVRLGSLLDPGVPSPLPMRLGPPVHPARLPRRSRHPSSMDRRAHLQKTQVQNPRTHLGSRGSSSGSDLRAQARAFNTSGCPVGRGRDTDPAPSPTRKRKAWHPPLRQGC